MTTFVVYAQRKPDVLARIVLLFHRRAVDIDSLIVRSTDNSNVLRMTLKVEADSDQSRLIESNLYKLVDVLAVRSNPCQAVVPERAALAGQEYIQVVYVVTTGGTIEK